ncbi:MAG: MBL fold metallo-hydrolase [Deltaproteobacteria bacterium]|nr:MBL fold metallo-hydrolase [Deltaproteobacteria bacterium]
MRIQRAVGSRRYKNVLTLVSFVGLILALPKNSLSFCHEMEVVQGKIFKVAASHSGSIAIEWFGHSTFQITSSKGTRILTDPHTRSDLPWPQEPQDIVTTSHQHGPHSNIWMAKGKPVILEGLTPGGENWSQIHMSIRDVSVYAVPAYHDKSQGLQRGKNAIFVFRVDGICIAHLGDLGHHLTPAQLKMLGKIDILLVPLAGGFYTITAKEAKEVTRQVNPKIAIPKHYWWEGAVEEYVQNEPRVKRINGRVFSISKAQLPQTIEIVVLSHNHR